MRVRRLPAAAILACILTTASSIGAKTPAGGARTLPTSEAWRHDLDHLVTTLEQVHPDLYARVSRERFAAEAARLREDIPRLTPAAIAVRTMQLVALVEDGHTLLEPAGMPELGRWFPVRLYRFDDGIFVTAVGEPHAEIAGLQVVGIGKLTAEEAWNRVAGVVSSDNAFGSTQNVPMYLCNAAVLAELGVIDDAARISLELQRADGTPLTRVLESDESPFDLEFRFWGEIWGPASDDVSYVTGFDGRPPTDFYETDPDLPLHLRYRSAYWFTYLADRKLFYVQFNFLGNSRRESFDAFHDRLWKAVDASEVELFVIDNRYNIGGDGSLVQRIVHEIIKRDEINAPGRLFTILGRATYSAGVMLTAALDEHTHTVFVGEPMGADYRHYGDGTRFTLPNSGIGVWVSTIYHQLDSYTGSRRVMPIQLPATFSSAAYFGGRDPALERILASRQRPTLEHLFRERGAEAALEAYEARLREFGGVDWWAPLSMRELNTVGNDLRREGRIDDAIAAYRLNARRHPDHWRVWYSLGRVYAEQGRREAAIEAYEKALAVDPYNNLAEVQRAALADLRTASAKG